MLSNLVMYFRPCHLKSFIKFYELVSCLVDQILNVMFGLGKDEHSLKGFKVSVAGGSR